MIKKLPLQYCSSDMYDKMVSYKKIGFTAVLLLSICSYLFSQISSSLFDNYSVSDGLSDKTIHCIYQDTKGWIWIGTDFGILQFDGYSFKKFNINTPACKRLEKALIRVIFEDKYGKIWIGSESEGIFFYDRNIYDLKQIINGGLDHNSVWDICQDKHDNIWIATENGLNKLDYKSRNITSVFDNDSIEQPTNLFIRKVLYYTRDNIEYIWFGTDDGVYKLNIQTKKITHYLTEGGIDGKQNEIWELFKDSKGNIWAGAYLGGLNKFNFEENRFENVTLDKENERAVTVRSIVEDNNGNMWFGTRGGLYKFEKTDNSIIYYTHNLLDNYSLAHNSVLDLYIDRKGDLWVGTRNGISYLNFDKQAFGYITAVQDQKITLNNSEVYALWEDDDNKIWIGTEMGGLNIFNRKTNKIQYLTISNHPIKAISPDKNGNILIGTFIGGLNQYNPKTKRDKLYINNPEDSSSIIDNTVWSIFIDSKDRILVGTSRGIDIFNPITGKFKRYSNKLDLGMAVYIFEDYLERLWIYSEDHKKLYVVKNDEVIFTLPYKARSICKDDAGNLWLSTLGSGLVKYNIHDNSITTYTIDDGLSSNVIYGSINQDNKYIWLSTNNGISRFDIHEKKFKNFDQNDGILNSQYNYGAYLQCNDGTLLFGGKKGLDFIFINRLKPNSYIPPVVLTDFRIFNKSVPIIPSSNDAGILHNLICETNSVVIGYNRNMISFEFAALNYAGSNKNKYKYKLIGFDKEWNEVATQRLATYTNLDPGEYTLRILGSNNDNLFSEEGLSLQLTVLPPFWKTWLFRILIIAFLVLLGYIVYLFIVNREKLKHQLLYERQTARKVSELDMMKHEFFMNISHEIRTPLSLILGPLDKLLNNDLDKESLKTHLQIIKRNTQNLSKLVNQLLDYRKLETGNVQLELKKGNLSVFVQEIINSFNDLGESKNIKLKYNTIPKNIVTLFDPDKIEKIINNLVSNAIKYTRENGHVYVSMSLVFLDDINNFLDFIPDIDAQVAEHLQFVQIVVKDTGIGIPSSQLAKIFNRFKRLEDKEKNGTTGSGIGLSLTKELVKIHKGYIRVESKEGKGSKFIVLIPFSEEGGSDINVVVNDKLDSILISRKEKKETKSNELVEDSKVGKPLVIVIDDNKDIREFIHNHFEPEYIVLEAKNGKEGWEIILETIPDIVIADIMMPIMDGNDLCRKIKHDERTSHIPVVILTALTSKDKQYAGIDAGAEDYITKPFDIALLKAKIDNILAIRKNLRERFSKELILKPKDIILSSPDEKFLKRVIQVIEKNMDNNELDIDFLAKHTGVSRTQLYRKIKALTDMAVKEFVKDIRLQRGSQLLMQDRLNISEIAYEIGFSDISYFRKCFKEKYGMSASEYQKTHRSK